MNVKGLWMMLWHLAGPDDVLAWCRVHLELPCDGCLWREAALIGRVKLATAAVISGAALEPSLQWIQCLLWRAASSR